MRAWLAAAAIRAKSCGTFDIAGIFRADSAEPSGICFMTLFSTAQHLARTSRGRSQGHLLPILARRRDCGERGRGGRLFAVADLGRGRIERPGAVAGQHRRHPVQRADRGDPDEDPAPFRAAGAHRPFLQLPFARASRGAEACQRGHRRRGSGAADRPDLPVGRGASRHAGAGYAGAHHLSALPRSGIDACRRRTDAKRVSRRHALRRRRSVRCRHA